MTASPNTHLMAGWPQLLPGVTVALAAAVVAYLGNWAVPLLSSLLLAILLGVALRNLGWIPEKANPGLKIVGRTILRLGVVLLGLRLSLPQVMALGWGAVAVIVLAVSITYLATLGLGRLLGVGRNLRILLATGSAICGAAAVAGMSAVLRPTGEDKEDSTEDAAATAVAAVTVFGTVSLLVVPVLARLMGFAELPTGVFLGASVHEVGQVVAASGLAAGDVLDTATVTKLGRVALLAPMVAIVGALETRRLARIQRSQVAEAEVAEVLAGEEVDHAAATRAARTPIVPAFVLGFLALVLLRSVIGSPPAVMPIIDAVNLVATFLLTMAMVAMGAGVNLRILLRTGGKSMLLGLLATLTITVTTLLATWLLV